MKIETLRRAIMDHHTNLERLGEYDAVLSDTGGKMAISYGIESTMPKGPGSPFTIAERYAIRCEAVRKPRERILEKIDLVEDAMDIAEHLPEQFPLLIGFIRNNLSIRQYGHQAGITFYKARKQFDSEVNALHALLSRDNQK